jgi:outer membrane protein assembly factor BamB
MNPLQSCVWRAFAALVVVLSMEPALAADWPRFRGPDGQGISPDKGLPVTWSETENVVWKTELPGAGTSSPIVVGSKIYLTCYSGFNMPGKRGGQMEDLKLHFACLDRDSGKVLWTKGVQPKLPEQATIREGHGYASGTPVADGERIYVFFGKTGVIAFDHDGKQLWTADVGDKLHGWGSATSPVLAGELVIVNASVESESLVGLDRKTGTEVWRATGIKDSWCTPIVVTPDGGTPELVVAIFGKVLAFDPATGKRLWSCDTDIGWYMVPSLVSQNGVVYCIGGRQGGGALAIRAGGRGEVTKTHRLWAIKKGSNVSSPVYHDGHLYWMNDVSATAFCAEAKTGKIVYEEKIEGVEDVYASPVLADGKLYYVTRSGRGIVLAAKPTFEKLAVNDLRRMGTFNASPAIADGKLLLRSDRFLFCLGTK